MITRENVAKLLAYMAAFDKRTIGDADVLAWFRVIPVNLGYERAMEAVRLYYQQNTRPIMPAELIQYAKTVSLNPPLPPEDTSSHINIREYGIDRFWNELDGQRAKNGYGPLPTRRRRRMAAALGIPAFADEPVPDPGVVGRPFDLPEDVDDLAGY